ncbi:MAG: SDR family oxidoreductase [Bacteroidetes bacterium]|nr:SDR family oxidoreductase [Bacteroidota bacterium]
MNLGLNEKVIVISGAVKGIGQTIADLLIEENAIPVFVAQPDDDHEKIIADTNTGDEKCRQFITDITKQDNCCEVINTIIKSYGRIDAIINNPAISGLTELKACNYEDFWLNMQHGIVPCYLMTHFALPALKKSKGIIVNLTYLTSPTSKQNGQTALAREWAVELLPYKIRVNALAIQGNKNIIKDLANTVLFLLSERASHITGEIIYAGNNIYTVENEMAEL